MSSSYAASRAIDRTVGTRWNSNGAATTNYIIVRLDRSYNINQFKVKHVSTAGLSANLNTERFYILYWTGSAWANAVTNYYNGAKAGTTTHNVNVTAQYVCLYITDPTFTSDKYSRIPEFEVYGSSAKMGGPEQSAPPYPIFSDVALSGSSLQALPSIVEDGQVRFSVNMDEIAEGSLEVLDLNGNVVKTLGSRVWPAGITEMDMNLSDLSAGVYLYRMVNFDGASEVKKLIVR